MWVGVNSISFKDNKNSFNIKTYMAPEHWAYVTFYTDDWFNNEDILFCTIENRDRLET